MTAKLDPKELRKVAESATPGPWETLGGQGPFGTHAVCHRMEQGTLVEIAYRDAHFDKANAVHIAAFDPPTVLVLLSRLEQAEHAVQRAREVHRPVDVEPSETICHACSTLRGNGESLRYFPYKEWPCDTIRALDGDVRG